MMWSVKWAIVSIQTSQIFMVGARVLLIHGHKMYESLHVELISSQNILNITMSVTRSGPLSTTSQHYSLYFTLQRRTRGKEVGDENEDMSPGFKVSSWLSGSFFFPLIVGFISLTWTITCFYKLWWRFSIIWRWLSHWCRSACECSWKWCQWNQSQSRRGMRGHFSFSVSIYGQKVALTASSISNR